MDKNKLCIFLHPVLKTKKHKKCIMKKHRLPKSETISKEKLSELKRYLRRHNFNQYGGIEGLTSLFSNKEKAINSILLLRAVMRDYYKGYARWLEEHRPYKPDDAYTNEAKNYLNSLQMTISPFLKNKQNNIALHNALFREMSPLVITFFGGHMQYLDDIEADRWELSASEDKAYRFIQDICDESNTMMHGVIETLDTTMAYLLVYTDAYMRNFNATPKGNDLADIIDSIKQSLQIQGRMTRAQGMLQSAREIMETDKITFHRNSDGHLSIGSMLNNDAENLARIKKDPDLRATARKQFNTRSQVVTGCPLTHTIMKSNEHDRHTTSLFDLILDKILEAGKEVIESFEPQTKQNTPRLDKSL